jgi:hypothetical protein
MMIERRAVAGWLEREGIKHDIYAESQLEDETLVLDEYKVLLITTHPEYWTRKMFFQVRGHCACTVVHCVLSVCMQCVRLSINMRGFSRLQNGCRSVVGG